MINFLSSKKNLEIKRLGKYILPVCFILLAILYAGTKPQGRNAARANAKSAMGAEMRGEIEEFTCELKSDEIFNGCVLVEARTNEVHDFLMPTNAAICEKWKRRGCSDDFHKISFNNLSQSIISIGGAYGNQINSTNNNTSLDNSRGLCL